MNPAFSLVRIQAGLPSLEVTMALGIGSAMKEDLKSDRDRLEDDSMAFGSSMKEDLKRDRDKIKDDSMAVGSAMKEDLKKDLERG